MNEIKKLPLVSDLKAKEVRCKIKNIDKNGEEVFITVYNIKGERRNEIVQQLESVLNDDKDESFNMFYLSLMIEFTDLMIDTKDVKFLLDSGNMASQLLLQEFNDMVYELQYQMAMEQLANVRKLALTKIADSTLKLMEDVDRKIKEMNDLNE